VIPGYQNATLTTIGSWNRGCCHRRQLIQHAPADLRNRGRPDGVGHHRRPAVVTHDDTGDNFLSGVDPALEGRPASPRRRHRGEAIDLRRRQAAPRRMLHPEQISSHLGPRRRDEELAMTRRQPCQDPVRRGWVHFFNNDNRTIILVAVLTDNVGHYGGTVGSYAGNYRLATPRHPSGLRDPFNPHSIPMPGRPTSG
jgi:hypothetical protein